MNVTKTLRCSGLAILSICVMHCVASAQTPNLPSRRLIIHGPFFVDTIFLRPASNTVPGASAPVNDSSNTFGTGTTPPSGQTPRATRAYQDAANFEGIDPGIAVGESYILLSDDRTGITVYDKAGRVVGNKGVKGFPNPFTIDSLFSFAETGQGVIDGINKNLYDPATLPYLPSSYTQQLISGYGDVRVMYDSYRKRFWIYAAAGTPGIDAPTVMSTLWAKYARRSRAVVAVSKTEDPRDGFYTYWWNEVMGGGECTKVPVKGVDTWIGTDCFDPSFLPGGAGADYPSIGITPKFLLATVAVNRRDPNFFTMLPALAQTWVDCETGFKQDGQYFEWCGPVYSHLMMLNADDLATGCSTTPHTDALPQNGPCGAGTSFALFVNAKNLITDRTETGDFAASMSRGVRPVVMHGPEFQDPSQSPLFVNNFIDRHGNINRSNLVVWSLQNGRLSPVVYSIRPFTLDYAQTDWKIVMNAIYRDGNLYTTFHQCSAHQGDCWSGIRLLEVQIGTHQVVHDKLLAGNNRFDDPVNMFFHYTFPGVEVNKDGDIVIVSTRYCTDLKLQQKQEIRFYVWFHNEPDIRADRLLIPAAEFDGTGTDTAGISVDPTDDGSVWVAHLYSKNITLKPIPKPPDILDFHYGIGFGKILGKSNRLLWHNPTTGELSTWLLDPSGSVPSYGSLSWKCDAASGCSKIWKAVGTGDFDHDGRSDVLWYNSSTGELSAWLLDGFGNVTGTKSLSMRCDAASGCSQNWELVGTGDFNSDGNTDVLWYNPSTGELSVWFLDEAGNTTATQTLSWKCDGSNGCSKDWKIVGIADFNRDGHLDILWHKASTGELAAWLLDGAGTVTGTQAISQQCGAADGCSQKQKVIGTLDFNDDGRADILWYNPTSGDITPWLLDGLGNATVVQAIGQQCSAAALCSQNFQPVGVLLTP